MSVTLDNIRTSELDTAKCEAVEQKIIDILNSSNLNLLELIFVLAQTIIDVGGTIEGINKKLTYTDMWRRYATEPKLGNALMAQGADILHDWLRILDGSDRK